MIAFSYPILLVVICTVYAVLTRKIPEAALGKSIKLEFRFESDEVDFFPAAGWYIDDVEVTVP